MNSLVVIAHNIRSTYNVGSLLRTAEGLGIHEVYCTGHTPYPTAPHDSRLPHVHEKLTKAIHKTALGAETTQVWEHHPDIDTLIATLKKQGYVVAALEQTQTAVPLPTFTPPTHLVLIVGREVEGVESEILEQTDLQLVIPMFGSKESFNVVQAAAMALYHCRFHT